MSLPQPDKVVFYHPLDDDGGWSGTPNTVAGKVDDAQGAGADLTGVGSYPTAAAAQRAAFAGWFVKPAEAASMSVAGYACGGYKSPTRFSTVDKLSFSDDGVTAVTSTLTGSRLAATGFASTVSGYVCGGRYNGGWLSAIDKLLFSDDSIAANTSTISASRYVFIAGFGSSATGYACGGYHPGNAVFYDRIDKLSFSDESTAINTSSLTATRSHGAAGFSSTTSGYACGGSDGVGAPLWIVEKLSFSGETIAVIVSVLSVARDGGGGGVESTTAGYACGGRNGWAGSPYYTVVDKLDFSDDSVAAVASTLTIARVVTEGFGSMASGYICGGGIPYLITIDKLNFSDDSVALNSSSLTATRSGIAAFENAPVNNF